LKLCHLLRELQLGPLSNRQTCLLIQEEVLKRIMRIEKKIREHRRLLKELRRHLGSKKQPTMDKTIARQLKDNISWHHRRIKEYQLLLITFKTIVDALAFIYFDKWDIKPQSIKESPGFVSENVGLKFELRIFQLVFSLGHIGILNDLTNCLRYGDVSILARDRKLIVEAKSGHSGNPRTQRQKSELENIANYLTYDKSDKLPYIEGDVQRLATHGPEIDNRDQLNSMISRAHRGKSKYCLEEVEPGLYYGATYVANTDMFSLLLGKPPGSLIISLINELKYSGLGYYPLSLSIYEPTAWYDFYSGALMILVAIDIKLIEEKLSREGISIKLTAEWDRFPVELTSLGSKTGNKSLIGGHFFGRLFYEFLSLDWLLDEMVYRYHHDDATEENK